MLATKFAMPMGPDDNQRGGSPRWIKRAVQGSLRRLGTDYIDLYQMHRPDYPTDIGETLSALSDLVHAGTVRFIGSSTFPAELIVEAQVAADPARGHRVATAPQAFDLAIPANQVRQDVVRQLTKLAADAGLPLTHLATAFARSHPAVTSVLTGPGRRRSSMTCWPGRRPS